MNPTPASVSTGDVAPRSMRGLLGDTGDVIQKAGIGLALVVLIILASVLSPYFLQPGNLLNVARQVSIIGVIAVGMTFVIVTSGIDLAVGSVMAFTGIWLAEMLAGGTSALIAIPTILAGGALIGLLIGVLVQYFDVQPFIASLAGLFLARGLAYVVSTQSIRVENEAVLWLAEAKDETAARKAAEAALKRILELLFTPES